MVSILLPISGTEDSELIKLCLESLAKQTYFRAKRENGGYVAGSYKDFEVLIVTSKSSAKRISPITKKYPFVKVLEKKLGKGAARNFAAQKAKGEYLYHLDANMAPTPQVLTECVRKAEGGAEAITVPEVEAPQAHFISKCRALEWRILRGSRSAITPLFLKKPLFEKAGGYDEDLDPADDWNLHLTLRKMGVEFESVQAPVLIRGTTSLKKALKGKYEMGRIYPLLKTKYPQPRQLNPKLRFEDYFRNWREIIKSPHLSLGLFILKIGDISAFFWGTLHPIEPKNRYTLPKVAEEYERKRLGSNFGRYKHFAELKSLFKLLPKEDSKILEVGCGTGRITAELVKRRYKVTPVDSSRAMLAQYKQKPKLPKPQLANAVKLPFPDNSFPIVFALRVIWHLLDKEEREKMLFEMARVSSSLIILDITNKKRWPKFYRDRQWHTYFFTWEEFGELCKESNLKIEERIPLDTLAPLWLNLLPSKLATNFFPSIYKADLLLARLIPPGRYLVKLSKL